MKKKTRFLVASLVLLIALVVSFCCLTLESCARVREKQENLITPYSFPGSVWKSTEPEIVLEVSKESAIPADALCYIVCEGKRLNVVFFPGYPQRAAFELRDAEGLDIEDVRLIVCDADFSENSVELRIVQDRLFDGAYKTIVLERQA